MKIHQIAWKKLTSETTEKSLKFNFFSTDCDRKQTPDETVNVE
jgi:hypothetical protein